MLHSNDHLDVDDDDDVVDFGISTAVTIIDTSTPYWWWLVGWLVGWLGVSPIIDHRSSIIHRYHHDTPMDG